MERRLPPLTKAALAVGIGATAGLAVLFAWSRSPAAVERGYVEGIGPWIQGAIAAVTGLLPISLAEWVEIGAIAVGLGGLGWTARELWRQTGRRAAVLARAAVALWIAASVAGFLFYVTWGLAYARPPAEQRLGWIEPGEDLAPITAEELTSLSDQLVNIVNELYLSLHRWPDDYAPTTAPHGIPAADAAIDRAYATVTSRLGLHPSVARPRGPSKPLATSLVFSYLGIGGFYFPFTAEANIDADAPEWQRAHTMAHEKAHQRFFNSENEANFFGFLATIHAEDDFVRYGGWLFAQRQVLRALSRTDDTAFQRIISRRYPGVQRDVNVAHDFWAQYQGTVSALSDSVNDRYLRLNGVEGGVHSYSRSVELVVEWLRRYPPDQRQPSPTAR